MRARQPDRQGLVDRGGVRIHHETYENSGPTVVLVPTWCLLHSRSWKFQIPYLSRHYRVVTYDPRGNGGSDRPRGPEQHSWRHYLDDLLAVLDVTGTEHAVLVGVSYSGYWANLASVLHPDRVRGVVSIAPVAALGIGHPERARHSYTEVLDTDEGWAKDNVHFIRSSYREYVEFFVSEIFSEAHSTKAIEDCVGWAMETDAEMLISSDSADLVPDPDMPAFYRTMTRPLLLIHGDGDRIIPLESSRRLADLTGGALVTLQGAGHCPQVRDPVKVNLLIRDFVDRLVAARGVPA
jgi:pimeloyl-ACP methyl ester carboxylesterase